MDFISSVEKHIYKIKTKINKKFKNIIFMQQSNLKKTFLVKIESD